MKRVITIVLALAAASAAGLSGQLTHNKTAATVLILEGNVDLRQTELAFNNSERIAAVLVQEGDRVRRGQVLARLDTSRLEPQVAQAEAQAAAQRQVVERLRNGSRPEEIAQARAQVAAQRRSSSGCTTAAGPKRLPRRERTSSRQRPMPPTPGNAMTAPRSPRCRQPVRRQPGRF